MTGEAPPVALIREGSVSPRHTGPVTALITTGGAVLGLLAVAVLAALGLPLVAPILLAAVLALPLLLVRPVACLVLATVVEAGNLSGFAAANGVPGVYVLTLGLVAAAVALAVLRGELRPGWTPVFLFGLLLLAAQALTTAAADHPATDYGVVEATTKALVWLGLLTTLLLAPGHGPRAVARAFVVTLAGLSALTVVQEFALQNSTTFFGLANVPLGADPGSLTARHAGPLADVNFWARVLVLGLPFAFSLAQMASSRGRSVLWLGAGAAIALGIVLTGSRGALLAMLVVVVVWALLAGGRYARALLLMPLLVGLALLIPGVGSRLATLSALTDSSLQAGDASLEGRLAAQRVAVQILLDHPAFGIGPGNFLAVGPDYLRRLALDSFVLAPHNQYLESAAESGLLGLTAWLLFLGSAAFAALRARLTTRSMAVGAQRAAPVPLANAVLAALAGWAVASLFLHLATFRSFLLVAALAAALDLLSRRARAAQAGAGVNGEVTTRDLATAGGATGGPATAVRERPVSHARLQPGRAMAALAVLVFAGVVTGWGVSRPGGTWAASASAQLVLKPAPTAEPGAYELDTLSRAGLVRTFATVMADSRFVTEGAARLGLSETEQESITVQVSNSTPSGLVVITALGNDPAEVQALSVAVRAAAANYVNALSPLYGVEAVPGDPSLREVGPPVLPRLVLLLVGLGTVAAAGLWFWRGGGPTVTRRAIDSFPRDLRQGAPRSLQPRRVHL